MAEIPHKIGKFDQPTACGLMRHLGFLFPATCCRHRERTAVIQQLFSMPECAVALIAGKNTASAE
jgi:hypothetical protein